MDMSTFGFDVVVMCTGIILVFFILVLLMLIITLEGKFFDAKNAKKDKKQMAEKAGDGKGENVQKAAAPAPVVEKGIPGAVVAVIAAAIAAISGGKYTLRAVRRANGESRGNWGRAGVSDVTSPF
ncbi:MAG: OadG family protein [Faecalibacterium sp.]|jgi:sodium pump decarboxylase gamma subunit|nr:OadG family protein [Faecalibacterium sp.]